MSGTQAGCAHMALLIQADQDGELSAAEAAAMLAHASGCTGCAALREKLACVSTAMRQDTLRHAASAGLRRSVMANGRLSDARTGDWARRHALGAMLGAALAACVVLALPRPAPRDGVEVSSVVDAHLRALQPGHLLDVVSTDRHTVRPWFDGRLDYAPPVRDFAAAGFPLKGARLDVLGRPVAALVYGRDKHLIDVYVFPGAPIQVRQTAWRGYNVVAWSVGGMVFWAVSDLEAADLARFARLWG